MKIENFFSELKRRKVFKVGAAYLVVAWLAVQAASIGFPAFDAPPWALRIFILIVISGFPNRGSDGVGVRYHTGGREARFRHFGQQGVSSPPPRY